MTRRYYVNNAPQQTLASSITNSATSLNIAGSFSGWPVQFPFYATIDIGQLSEEIVLVTNIVGSTATITRAQDGSAAVSHAAGATLDFTVVAKDFDETNAHVNANTGVHGVSGNVVGTSDAQTLTNKTIDKALLTGDISTAAVRGKQNGTGKLASLLDSSSTEKFSVDASGNVVASGNLALTGSITNQVPTRITDWNNATATGFYVGGTGIPNSPDPNRKFLGTMMVDPGTGYGVQTLYQSDNMAQTAAYQRLYQGGSWGPWVQTGGTPAAWTNIPLASGCVTAPQTYTPAYWSNGTGKVELRGGIGKSSGSFASGAVLFTLPTALRPSAIVRFAIAGNVSSAITENNRIEITTDGVCTLYAGSGDLTFISLDGLSYWLN